MYDDENYNEFETQGMKDTQEAPKTQEPAETLEEDDYIDMTESFYGEEKTPEPRPQKPEKKKGAGKVIAIALGCSLLGGVIGALGMAFFTGAFKGDAPKNNNSTTLIEGMRETAAIDIAQADTSKKMSAAEIYAANVNSTVGITTSVTTNYFGFQTTSAASGSGFILSAEGYIITNYHVIEDADSVTVTTYAGDSYKAEVIGYDASNDIAVLKIEAEGLVPVILGDSGNMNVGDDVIAIGNPLGELTFSLTSGSVSALDREVTINNTAMNLIQTDCAINSGNSGGALFNMYGEVIGITNAKYSNSSASGASIDNIGFAIPINSVRNIFESIIEKGYIAKPYIGISVGNVSDEMLEFGLPKGAVVKSVEGGSPAEQAGLQVNDIVTHLNGTEIKSASELVNAVKDVKVGDVLEMTVYRQGQTVNVSVVVSEIQQSALQQNTSSEQQYDNSFPFPWGNPFN